MDQLTELPRLTPDERWSMAEGNLIYFVAAGIAYAKSKGKTAAEFGEFAGRFGSPYWAKDKGKGPAALVQGISENKQQFRGFEMEILSESPTSVEARMKSFGDEAVRTYFSGWGVTVEDYFAFFEAKWRAIADLLEIHYVQRREGEWTICTLTRRGST
jgi:hypothetical protein